MAARQTVYLDCRPFSSLSPPEIAECAGASGSDRRPLTRNPSERCHSRPSGASTDLNNGPRIMPGRVRPRQEMLDAGEVASVTELAGHPGVDRSYASHIMPILSPSKGLS